MQRPSFFWIVYAIFWGALVVTLVVSLHLGLNSTFPWYTETTSYNMYLAMTLLSVLLLVASLTFTSVQAKRFSRLERRVNANRDGQSSTSWRDHIPLILMIVLFLGCSAFALATCHEYLLTDHKANTILVLFTGSLSKIAVGLFAVIAFRTGLRDIRSR